MRIALNEERRLQIYEYLERYFGELREFLTREPQYQQYTPDIFKLLYVFVVIECRNGYVAAAYPGHLADNYLYFDALDKHVGNVMRSLPSKIYGTNEHLTLAIDDLSGSGLFSIVIDAVETTSGPLPTTGYKFLFVATLDFEWPTAEARKSAEEWIDILKARALVYSPGESVVFLSRPTALPENKPAQEATHHILDVLRQTIEEYQNILTEKEFRERVIHQFIRDHRVLLHPTKRRLLFEYPLKVGKKVDHKIDFVVELTTERYILVELENPRHTLFTVQGDFRQVVNHAEQQVSDWFAWIRRNRHLVEKDLPGIIAPEGLIVIGRSASLTDAQKDKLRIRNEQHLIKIVTYDDLAEEAENLIHHLLDV